MRNLVPYFIAEQLRAGRSNGGLDAAALFVDISGFTRLTEEMMRHGTEGAEILSEIIDDLFGGMVSLVDRHDGFVTNYAGDAFTAIFPIRKAGDEYGRFVELLACASAMRSFVEAASARQTRFGTFTFAVKIGCGVGPVEWGIVGSDQLAFYMRGAAIAGASAAEKQARAGEIVLDAAGVDLVGDRNDIVIGSNSTRFVLDSPVTLVEPSQVAAPPMVDREIATRFAPSIDPSARGDFRDVASIFMEIDGLADHEDIDRIATEVIERVALYGGYVKEIELVTSAIIPCFLGAPLAHEDNIGRALELVERLLPTVESIAGLRMRAGVTYGRSFTGIVGTTSRSQYCIIGRRVNLAARIMAGAEWCAVEVDGTVARHPGFSFEPLGSRSFRNVAEPTPVYRLASRRSVREPVRGREIAGRDTELEQLVAFAAPLFEGRAAGVAWIIGEAGMGKSTLAWALAEKLALQGEIELLVGRADPIIRRPFGPFISIIAHSLDLLHEISSGVSASIFDERLDEAIASIAVEDPRARELAGELERTRSVIAALLGVAMPGSLYEQLDARGRYQNTLYAIRAFLLALSLRAPVVLLLEDVHDLDNDSRGVFEHLARDMDGHAIMLMMTSRAAADTIALGELPSITIDLRALDAGDLADVARAILGSDPAPELVRRIVERTGGNPFFAEQMILCYRDQGLLEEGPEGWSIDRSADEAAVPESLNALLVARIDRLDGATREAVRGATVIGLQFESPLLAEVLGHDVAREIAAGDDLGIWHPLDDAHHLFNHALLRDAAYQMQLRSHLRSTHRAVAEAIVRLHGDTIDPRLAEIAHHYEQAGAIEHAIEYLERAGRYAREHYYNETALDIYERLASHLETSSGDPSRPADAYYRRGEVLEHMGRWEEAELMYRRFLDCATRTGDRKMIATAGAELGWLLHLTGESEHALTYLRQALAIAEEIGDLESEVLAARSLGTFHLQHAEYDQALEHYRRALAISEQLDDHHGIAIAIGNIGALHVYRGEADAALECYLRKLAIATELGDRKELAVASQGIAGVHLMRGSYDAALDWYERNIAIAEELGDRLSLSNSLSGVGGVHMYHGDHARALECFTRQLEIAEQMHDRRTIAIATLHIGIVHAHLGDRAQAVEQYGRALAIAEQIGDRRVENIALANMGSICVDTGEFDRAREILYRQLALGEELGDRMIVRNTTLNIANLHAEVGAFEEALEWCERHRHLAEETGDQREIHMSSGTRAVIHARLGNYPTALREVDEAIEGFRAIGNTPSIPELLETKASLLLSLLEENEPASLPRILAMTGCQDMAALLSLAGDLTTEGLELSRELARDDLQFRFLLADIRADRIDGRGESARTRLVELLASAHGDDRRAELHYWLWRTGDRASSGGNGDAADRVEALQLYQLLYSMSPRYEYARRIEELGE